MSTTDSNLSGPMQFNGVPDLVDVVLTQASARPTSTAVDHEGAITTYRELGERAFGIAAAIRASCDDSCPRVLIAVPRSAEAYAAMLGALVAGATFCPVDLDGPAERNAVIGKLFAPDVILYAGKTPEFLDACDATIPRVDVAGVGGAPLGEPAAERSEIAYIVFTSGSTGQPKGVKIGRRQFSWFLHVSSSYYKPEFGGRWGQFSPLGHDMAVMDVFMALTQGRALVPFTGPARFRPASAIQRLGVTIWQSVPSVLLLMARAKQVTAPLLGSLRVMSFCGEPLLPKQLDELFCARPDIEVFNTYGATETVGFNTINRLTAANYKNSCARPSVALGADVPGWSVSLRGGDADDEGEIVVASECLAHGYLADEERTRSAFRDVQLPDGKIARAYFTGDWGIRCEGQVYFKCRHDRQIKICGERIELDEIDHVLREHGYAEAHTVYDGNAVYSFVESSVTVDSEHVRTMLAKKLPFHAIPKEVRGMPALPRNANAKLDRTAIRAMVAP